MCLTPYVINICFDCEVFTGTYIDSAFSDGFDSSPLAIIKIPIVFP